MRIVLDLDKCLGYGNCVVDAPDIFVINDEDMVATILEVHPPESAREKVQLAVLDCPAQALTLEED